MLTRAEGRAVLLLAAVAWAALGGSLLLPGSDLPEKPPVEDGPRRVVLNWASVAELATLPGIGRVLAERIVRHRLLHGPFRSVDELARVPGIGPRRVERLKGRVTACPPPPCRQPTLHPLRERTLLSPRGRAILNRITRQGNRAGRRLEP